MAITNEDRDAGPGLESLRRTVRLGWLWADLRGRRRDIALIVLVTLVSPAVGLLIPLRVSRELDSLIAGGAVSDLMGELGVILAIIISSLILTSLRRFLIARLCLSVATDLRGRLFRHILSLAPRALQRTEGGQVTNAFTSDLGLLQSSLNQMLGKLFPGIFLATVYGAALFWFNWRLALTLILVFVPMAVLTNFFARRIHRAARAAQARQSELLGELAETLAGPKEIKLFRLEGPLSDRYSEVNRRAYGTALGRDVLTEVSPLTVSIIVATGLAGVILLSAVFLDRGWADAGGLAGFVACLGLLYPQVQEVSRSLGQTFQIFAARERIDRVLDMEPERDTLKGGRVPADGAISLKGVSFSYDGASPALHDLDLDIADGERVAIVGPSGAGKSTLLELLPRFNEPEAGVIEIGGVPLPEITLADLRDRIGLVLQVPFLFRGTLRENLAAGQEGLSDARIEEVAAQARVDEFAARLPLGYDTEIEPGGGNLSVGQRQRVAIARVLLRNPPILLLDEPTSALDVGSETHVAEAIRVAARGRTTIIVAHRLSTVRDVDRIIAMDNGRVVEAGSHGELVGRGGLYAELYAQFAGADGG